MSPVFRHGRLRLYLLKLLDESPRHGYEVIRLLQDRFMGVYAPSPGTIYPRLARLEEEGLVTHDEADGRKVYRITGKGREELGRRAADLSELEEEITASVRDIAREVTEDVRETVRGLRRELSFATRDMQQRGTGLDQADAGREGLAGQRERLDAERRRLDAEQQRLDAERQRLDGQRRRLEAAAAGPDGSADRAEAGRSPQDRGWGWGGALAGPDLEQLARQFTAELRAAAAHAHEAGEQAAGELRAILDEALDRIRSEVFRAGGRAAGDPGAGPGADSGAGPGAGPGARAGKTGRAGSAED